MKYVIGSIVCLLGIGGCCVDIPNIPSLCSPCISGAIDTVLRVIEVISTV